MNLPISDTYYHWLLDYLATHHPTKASKPLPWWHTWQIKQATLFQSLGIPSAQSENYRHTPLTKLFQCLHALPQHLSPLPHLPPPPTCFPTHIPYHPIIQGNYKLHHNLIPKASRPSIALFSQLEPDKQKECLKHINQQLPPSADSFVALNGALFQEGIWIHIPDHTHLPHPLWLHHLFGRPPYPMMHFRSLITLGENAQATIIDAKSQTDNHPLWVNSVQNIHLGKQAQLHYYNLQTTAQPPSHLMHHTYALQEPESHLALHHLTHQGTMVRNATDIRLQGTQSSAQVYGMYHSRDKQHIENHVQVHHQAPHTQSNTFYRGLATDRSMALFYGQISVDPQAAKTDAHQLHNGWLLSPRAHIYAHPRLAIQADDVRCTHGATLQKIDLEAMHYLQMRGISHQVSREMLINAFIHVLLHKIKDPLIRQYATHQFAYTHPS